MYRAQVGFVAFYGAYQSSRARKDAIHHSPESWTSKNPAFMSLKGRSDNMLNILRTEVGLGESTCYDLYMYAVIVLAVCPFGIAVTVLSRPTRCQ